MEELTWRIESAVRNYLTTFEQRDNAVIRACASFLASNSEDKSTPQKLFCGSSDSMPTCCSFEPSGRFHWTQNWAFLDPRCNLMIVPTCKCARSGQFIRAPVGVISTVCAKRVTLPTETLTDNTIFLRDDLRLFSIDRYPFPLLVFFWQAVDFCLHPSRSVHSPVECFDFLNT
jgi:hypothetical protein